MEPLIVLNDVRIASPCPARWSTLDGDERVRFCGLCSKNVYNLSGLTAAEAAGLIQAAGGDLCVHLYRRRDGTVLTADCPVGVRHSVRRRLLRLATASVVSVATLWAGIRLYATGFDRPEIRPVPTGPGVTLSDWADWAAEALGFRWPRARGQGMTVGVLMVSPRPDPSDLGTSTSLPESSDGPRANDP